MADESRCDQKSPGNDVGYIIGVAVVLVTLANAGLGAAAAKIIDMHGIKAGIPEFIKFGQLYSAAFWLSLSVTASIAAYGIPRIYGFNMHCGITPSKRSSRCASYRRCRARDTHPFLHAASGISP